MTCKKFLVECQENLQKVVRAVGSPYKENRELEKLVQDLLQICDDYSWHQHDDKINIKAINFARDSNFINATFCYRVFLQGGRFYTLRGLDIY